MIPESITLNGRSGTVVYLDAQWHPVPVEQATMARVLYEDGGSAFYVIQTVPVAKFDESLHPREPGGQSIGGEFAPKGTGDAAVSDPALASQAKDGIAAVEKLLPEAVKTAAWSHDEDWGNLDADEQEKVYQFFVGKVKADIVKQVALPLDYDTQTEITASKEVQADAPKNKAAIDAATQRTAELFKDRPVDVQRADDQGPDGWKARLDPATINVPDPGKRNMAGQEVLDVQALRHQDGSPLTQFEKDIVRMEWQHQHAATFDAEVRKLLMTPPYIEARASERWEAMADTVKNSYAVALQEAHPDILPPKAMTEPTQWETGIETGTHQDENYSRTHAIAERLTVLRTDELRKERGLLNPQDKPKYVIREAANFNPKHPNYVAVDETGTPVASSNTMEQVKINADEWANARNAVASQLKTLTLVESVWSAWKHKSSEGLGLSLQLAAAQEFHGVHRMTQDEEDEAVSAALPYGGIETLKAYVRAQWEVTQTVMAKAHQDKVDVYRALMLPGEQVKKAQTQLVGEHGEVLDPPTKITVREPPPPNIDDAGNPFESMPPVVTFEYGGKHYEIEKQVKTYYGVGAFGWKNDVSEEIKQKVQEIWMADAAQAAAAAHGNVGSLSTAKKLFEKMSDEDKLSVMRAMMARGKIQRPYESTEEAVRRRVELIGDTLFKKLPTLPLRRAGAQSTTGTLDVANEWRGVGNLPPDPVRVVLRIEAPPTSVLSLPVYGRNIIEEHESVLMGTRDKWLWDAWRESAPDFSSQPVSGKPKPKGPLVMDWGKSVDYDSQSVHKDEPEPLVIDLQEADRGKPHWMSDVDWQSIAKEKP